MMDAFKFGEKIAEPRPNPVKIENFNLSGEESEDSSLNFDEKFIQILEREEEERQKKKN